MKAQKGYNIPDKTFTPDRAFEPNVRNVEWKFACTAITHYGSHDEYILLLYHE